MRSQLLFSCLFIFPGHFYVFVCVCVLTLPSSMKVVFSRGVEHYTVPDRRLFVLRNSGSGCVPQRVFCLPMLLG